MGRNSQSLTLVAVLLLAGCRERTAPEPEPAAPRIHCVAAETKSLADEIVLRGTIVPAPDRSATLSAQVPGRLVRVEVREGDEVEKGALIAEVEAQPARDMLDQARAMLAEAQASRDAAANEAAHEAGLVERGIAAPRTLETRQAALARAEAAVAAATAQLHAARQGLSRTEVRAPLAGAVVHLLKHQGELVDGTPATSICQVVDLSRVELEAPAAPAELVRTKRGQSARVRFGALEGVELDATVRAVGRSVGLNGMGKVWLSLQLDQQKLPLGLLGTAELRVSEPHPVVTVPAVAVRSAGGQRSEAVVCAGSVASVREVQVGRRGDGWVELTSGVAAGERVATNDVTGLEEGTAITTAPESP